MSGYMQVQPAVIQEILHIQVLILNSQQLLSVSGTYTVISSNVNLIMGYPAPATTDINNPHAFLLTKDVFCASYDRDKGIPSWTRPAA